VCENHHKTLRDRILARLMLSVWVIQEEIYHVLIAARGHPLKKDFLMRVHLGDISPLEGVSPKIQSEK
jgi:hypothetical protein